MKEKIVISVIIPVYNVEKYLRQCVDSVLKQTYKLIEVILVDDGATDSSSEICDEYSLKDRRIKVIHKKNGGASSARNEGIKEAKGDFIVFLDGDDYWLEEEFLEYIVVNKIKEKTDIVIFGYTQVINNSHKHKRDLNFEKLIEKSEKSEWLKELINNNKLQSAACNKIVRLDMIRKYQLFFVENITAEDIDWTARVMLSSRYIGYYDKLIYYYRRNENSVSNNIKIKSIKDLEHQVFTIVELSKDIDNKSIRDAYMNYCAYQYITLLNCMCLIWGENGIREYINKAEKYRYILKYNKNKKVRIVYLFDKILGYQGMLIMLRLYLNIRRIRRCKNH